MAYEDRITIPTPEGIEVELTLAGIGSRFIASLIDSVIKLVLIVAVVFVLFGGAALFGGDGSLEGASYIGVAVFAIVSFLITFGYDVLFEVLSSGRTPGKRWTGLRVVLAGGHPVGFIPSAVRNLVRIVDALPTFYAIGLVAILATKRNQRLGDLAAGTVVVRELRSAVAAPPPLLSGVEAPRPPEELSTWDVSSVDQEDIATVRRFLERRYHLTPQARAQLAQELAERLRPLVGGAPDMGAETFLENLSVAKSQRS